MAKRGQAAMEFLMTYGWAILAVLITIASLAYFGALNINQFVPDSCILFPGVNCSDTEVTNIEARLTMRNGLGQNLDTFAISIPGCGTASAENGLSDGEKETMAVICNPVLKTGTRFKPYIDISYKQDSLTHTRLGSLSAIVQSGLIKNGGFEVEEPGYTDPISIPIDYWHCYYDDPVFCADPGNNCRVSMTLTTLDTFTGDYALRNQGVPPNTNNYCYNDIPVEIDPNKKYETCLYHKTVSGPGNLMTLHMDYYDTLGNQIPATWNVNPLAQDTPPTNWQSLCNTFGSGTPRLNPPNARYIVMYFFFQNANDPAYVTLVDDVSLREVR